MIEAEGEALGHGDGGEDEGCEEPIWVAANGEDGGRLGSARRKRVSVALLKRGNEKVEWLQCRQQIHTEHAHFDGRKLIQSDTQQVCLSWLTSFESHVQYCTHLLSSLPVRVQTLKRVISTLMTPNVNPANSPVSKISKIASTPAANHAGPVNLAGPVGEGVAVAAKGEGIAAKAGSPVPRRISELSVACKSSRASFDVRARWFMRGVGQRKTELMGEPSGAMKFCRQTSLAMASISASARVRLPAGRGCESEERNSTKERIRWTAMRGWNKRKVNIKESSISI